MENQIGDDQFGFGKERGTREAILALRQILDRRINVNRNSTYYTTFI